MANLISLFRMLLALGVVAMLFVKTPTVYWTAFVLTVGVIWLDGVDGYVARKLNEASKLGGVVDILADRVVEVTYWLAFSALGWVVWWIPLIVVVRGIVVDGLRSVAFEQGQTAFGASTMMQSPLGVLLVSSRTSRWLYAVAKAMAFSLMILLHVPGLPPSVSLWLSPLVDGCIALTVIFCVLRGLPVLAESARFFIPPKQT